MSGKSGKSGKSSKGSKSKSSKGGSDTSGWSSSGELYQVSSALYANEVNSSPIAATGSMYHVLLAAIIIAMLT